MGVVWYIALHSSQYMTINLPYCPLICPKICWKGVIKIEIVGGGEHLKRQMCTKWWREKPGEGGWACVAKWGGKGVLWGCGGEDKRKARNQGLGWRDRNSPVHQRLKKRHRDTLACSGLHTANVWLSQLVYDWDADSDLLMWQWQFPQFLSVSDTHSNAMQLVVICRVRNLESF